MNEDWKLVEQENWENGNPRIKYFDHPNGQTLEYYWDEDGRLTEQCHFDAKGNGSSRFWNKNGEIWLNFYEEHKKFEKVLIGHWK